MVPMAGEAHAVAGLALRDFVLVVREGQVNPAGMQVDRFAEVSADHRGALDVPAGAITTPRAFPCDVAVLWLPRLPQREIATVLLLVSVGRGGWRCCPGVKLALGQARNAPVGWKRAHLEVDRAVAGHIGVPLFDQPVDHRDLLGDVARGGRFFVRAQAVEGVAILVELLGQLPRDFPERPSLLAGPADGLVVDVGEIPDVTHLLRTEFELEQRADDVVDEERPELPDVRGGVDGRTAVIEAEDTVRGTGLQLAEIAGQ